MDAYICPYCGQANPDDYRVIRRGRACFSDGDSFHDDIAPVDFKFCFCLSCKRYSYEFLTGDYGNGGFHFRHPPMGIVAIPDYVPSAIKADYTEACSIVNASPKAAATLARRCLQGMIRDFWEVHGKNLYEEISAIEGKVTVSQWRAIDGLRKVGNIGAHMERDIDLIVDVDADEATQLLRLIEVLIKNWYITRHEEESLYSNVIDIALEKEASRRSSSAQEDAEDSPFDELDVYDEVATAGLGSYLDAPTSHREHYPAGTVPPRTDFGVVVSGDSMEPKINDGCTVFVQSASVINHDEIGIFLLDGKAYCKQLKIDRENRRVLLRSLNEAYKDIAVDESMGFRTIGRVLGSYPAREE